MRPGLLIVGASSDCDGTRCRGGPRRHLAHKVDGQAVSPVMLVNEMGSD